MEFIWLRFLGFRILLGGRWNLVLTELQDKAFHRGWGWGWGGVGVGVGGRGWGGVRTSH